MCQSRWRLERGGGGERVLSARSLLCQDWIVVVVVVNRDQHAGTLTLRYLSGVMSGRLMKGTEKLRLVPAVSVHVTSSHDLCTPFEKKPVDASPIQSWRSRLRTESKSGYPDYSPKNTRQNPSDSRKAKKTDGSLTSVHVYEEQVSKYVIGVSRPVNQCGHIRAMYEDK